MSASVLRTGLRAMKMTIPLVMAMRLRMSGVFTPVHSASDTFTLSPYAASAALAKKSVMMGKGNNAMMSDNAASTPGPTSMPMGASWACSFSPSPKGRGGTSPWEWGEGSCPPSCMFSTSSWSSLPSPVIGKLSRRSGTPAPGFVTNVSRINVPAWANMSAPMTTDATGMTMASTPGSSDVR